MSYNPRFPYPLYLVISEKACIRPWLEVAEQAIQGGVDIIQLREKADSFDLRMHKAKKLKQITDHYQIPLIINDDVHTASEIGAWGVHVGQTDMPPSHIRDTYGDKLHIGWSLETDQQLQSEEYPFVHHLGVSPVFSTPTKPDTLTEWGISGIRNLRHHTDRPLIAIGGIHADNIEDIWYAGADSIAVVSAICGSSNPYEASLQLKSKLL